VVEDDEVDAGAGVLPDDVDVSLSSVDNCAFVVFLNRIHTLMPAMSSMFQKTQAAIVNNLPL